MIRRLIGLQNQHGWPVARIRFARYLAGSLEGLFARLSAKWLRRSSPRSAECKMKMLFKKFLAKVFQPLIGAINDSRDSLVAENQKLRLEMLRILRDAETKISCLAAKSLPAKEASAVSSIQETEFRVFSQFGEDGIIQFLISNI